MKIKEFFKPSLLKIIIFIIILILNLTLGLEKIIPPRSLPGGPQYVLPPCETYTKLGFWVARVCIDEIVFLKRSGIDYIPNFLEYGGEILPVFMVSIIYWYILSCLITFGFEKIRKR